jgi:hypothetical protein
MILGSLECRRGGLMPSWKKVTGSLVVILILLWIPLTRYAIFWLLPVGSGIDDLIFVGICIVVFILAFTRGWVQLPKFFKSMGEDYEE